MRLLFITQKINQNDDDLAFVILWIKQFIREGIEVSVVCLEKGPFDGGFDVYSLGKEKGYGKIRRTLEFFKLVFWLKYDRVFVHMNPEYFTLAGWYWFLRGIPMYLWYTHYTMHIHLRLAGIFSKRMFAATPQSLPQYTGNPKKIITGHGIDVDFWIGKNHDLGTPPNEVELLSVHRICRSKRIEIVINSLDFLPENYKLTIYGRDVEKDYYQELKNLVAQKGHKDRVFFAGPVKMDQLKNIYIKHRLMVNMAYETIDKTMLEAMVFGAYPITTMANSKAIGLPVFPKDDASETIAKFIIDGEWKKYKQKDLLSIVIENHSLPALIKNLSTYIKYDH